MVTMSCLELLQEKGHDLDGYSPDFYSYLDVEGTEDECEEMRAWAERVYG